MGPDPNVNQPPSVYNESDQIDEDVVNWDADNGLGEYEDDED